MVLFIIVKLFLLVVSFKGNVFMIFEDNCVLLSLDKFVSILGLLY